MSYSRTHVDRDEAARVARFPCRREPLRRLRLASSLVLALALALPGLAAGCGPGSEPVPSSERPETVPEYLLAIAEAHEADPMGNPYDSAARLRHLLRLEPPKQIAARQRFELDLAFDLLYAGETKAAIERLRWIRDGLERSRDPNSALLEDVQLHLALAWLRVGEQANCIDQRKVESCLLPISGTGVYVDQEGARRAIEALEGILAGKPDDLATRWLLNIAYMAVGQHPEGVPEAWRIAPEVYESPAEFPRFEDVAASAGVDRLSLAGGAAMEDFDGDGRLDLLASGWGLRERLLLYRNRGDGGFEEVSRKAGLDGQLGGLNLETADFDNDGDVDILVLRGAWLEEEGLIPNSLLRNDGEGRFEDVTVEAGLLAFEPSQVGAWADYDGDGWLDLFVGVESGADDSATARPSRLYRNDGRGGFQEVTAAVGLGIVGYVKGASWGDYDGDGRPDLYVSVYGAPNRLLRNAGPGPDGAWSFEDVTRVAGVSEPDFSFPTIFFDYDNDGRLDLFVADYHQPELRAGGSVGRDRAGDVAADFLGLPDSGSRPYLYRNLGDGRFEDVTEASGLDHPTYTMGANLGDLNGDGWQDLYLGTGDPLFQTLVPNRLFVNQAGERFLDLGAVAGMAHLQKGHAIAVGDIDGDGDQDLYAVMGGAFSGDAYYNALFENPGTGRRWVTLLLEGRRSNRDGIGARIRVTIAEGGRSRDIHVLAGTGGSFGASSLRQEIGLGDAEAIEQVTVTWPSTGEEQSFGPIGMDRAWRLVEGEAEAQALDLPRSSQLR